jgi:hypothetical protein
LLIRFALVKTSANSMQRPLDPPVQMRFVSSGKLVLPNAENMPASPTQCAGNEPVTRLVAGNLIAPERRIVLGLGAMLGTTMPETTIHKQCEPHLPENKIRLAEYFLIPPPASDLVSSEKLCERDFRGFVPTPANPRHHFRTLLFGKHVSHFFLTTDGHG